MESSLIMPSFLADSQIDRIDFTLSRLSFHRGYSPLNTVPTNFHPARVYYFRTVLEYSSTVRVAEISCKEAREGRDFFNCHSIPLFHYGIATWGGGGCCYFYIFTWPEKSCVFTVQCGTKMPLLQYKALSKQDYRLSDRR